MTHSPPEAAELEREAMALRAAVRSAPDQPKLWRTLAACLCKIGDYAGAARVWADYLDCGGELVQADPKPGEAFLERLAGRLFPFLVELVQTATVVEPDGLAGRWALARRLYAEPRFADLASRFPARFDAFVSLAGEDLVFKAEHKHGADISPLAYDAFQLYAPPNSRERLVRACQAEIAALHGGLDDVSAAARRLCADEIFHAPVVVCGFHHSGTRLLARLLAEIGLVQRINTYQYEWSYANQLNTLIEPGCMDPAHAGTGGAEAGLVSAERLAFRMAMAGLDPGVPWGFKDPRNGLTAPVWLRAFPNARILHILRDPTATIGSLPSAYDRFVRLDEERPSAVRFWIELWERYVQGARRAMSSAAASAEIRFEDLCRDPAGTLQQVVDGLGLGLEIDPTKLQQVAIEPGKTHMGEALRAEGRLAADDLKSLTTLGERYGYG